MSHPWLEIPIADYEAHMALPSVGQATLLRKTLKRAVDCFRPSSFAVLGVAGGNGLEGIDADVVRRLVALDFNPEYLELCARRHSGTFCNFEPVLHDLSQGRPEIAPVECLFAGLVLEYLNWEVFADYLSSILTPGGGFAVLLQLPSSTVPEVSPSPYASLARLEKAFAFVDPAKLEARLNDRGFATVEAERYDLDSGKSFLYAAYQAPPSA